MWAGGQGAEMKIGEKIDSIRVLLLAGLTEVILALPALRALRVHFPSTRITVLTSPAGSELLQTIPWLDEAIAIGRFRKGELFELATGYRTIRSIRHLRQLRQEGLGPDLQIDLSGGLSTALLRYLTGSAFFGASGTAGLIEKNVSLLRQGSDLHLAHDYLRRLEPLGVRPVIATPELSTNPEANLRIERMLRRLGIESGHLLIGLHPGRGCGTGEAGENGWPIDRFVALGQRLVHQYDARLLILAGPGEEQRRRRLAAALPRKETIRVETLPLLDLLSLTARLSLLIANAGAVPHLGAAVGVPVVAISLSARPSPTEVLNERTITIRAPHFDQPDLHNEEAVFYAAAQLLSLNRSGLFRDFQR